eukprot:2536335-Pyramimonas_sp.AAC.1
MGDLRHAVDRQTGGELALAGFVRGHGRGARQAATVWLGIATKGCEGLPPAGERRQVHFAAVEEP